MRSRIKLQNSEPTKTPSVSASDNEKSSSISQLELSLSEMTMHRKSSLPPKNSSTEVVKMKEHIDGGSERSCTTESVSNKRPTPSSPSVDRKEFLISNPKTLQKVASNKTDVFSPSPHKGQDVELPQEEISKHKPPIFPKAKAQKTEHNDITSQADLPAKAGTKKPPLPLKPKLIDIPMPLCTTESPDYSKETETSKPIDEQSEQSPPLCKFTVPKPQVAHGRTVTKQFPGYSNPGPNRKVLSTPTDQEHKVQRAVVNDVSHNSGVLLKSMFHQQSIQMLENSCSADDQTMMSKNEFPNHFGTNSSSRYSSNPESCESIRHDSFHDETARCNEECSVSHEKVCNSFPQNSLQILCTL